MTSRAWSRTTIQVRGFEPRRAHPTTFAGLAILREKDAWNHAIFFGIVAAVTAWRLNSDPREALSA